MPTFTAENRDDWHALFAHVEKNAPRVGKRVRVVQGRKHRGVTGFVTWHGADAYASTHYCSSAQLAMRQAMGRTGYRIKIAPDDGSAEFFLKAEYVKVI